MNEQIDLPAYLTPAEVARLLLVSPVTVRQWSQKGWLQAEQTAGGHRRYLRKEIERFVAERGLAFHSGASGKKKIMIVDDNRQLVRYLKDLFDGETGVGEVGVSHGGFEAGMKVRSFMPDVILLDLMMPELDGFSVCKILKKDSATRNIRVLAMTGYHTDESEQRILSEGAEICLSKPIDTELLLKTLAIGKYFSKHA